MSYYVQSEKPEPYFTLNCWNVPVVVNSEIDEFSELTPAPVRFETITLVVEGWESVTQSALETLAVPYSIDSSVLAAEITRNLYSIQMQIDTALTGETPRQYSLRKAIEHRLSAIESDEISDDAVSSALLTLIGNLSARIAALEAA